MMLFDAPSNTTSSASMAAAAVDYARTVNRTPQVRETHARDAQVQAVSAVQATGTPASANSAGLMNPAGSAETHQAGVNHMGDLARLVLLRYDLLARRREEIAARHAS